MSSRSSRAVPRGYAAADAAPALSVRGRLPRAGKRPPLILSLRSRPRRVDSPPWISPQRLPGWARGRGGWRRWSTHEAVREALSVDRPGRAYSTRLSIRRSILLDRAPLGNLRSTLGMNPRDELTFERLPDLGQPVRDIKELRLGAPWHAARLTTRNRVPSSEGSEKLASISGSRVTLPDASTGGPAWKSAPGRSRCDLNAPDCTAFEFAIKQPPSVATPPGPASLRGHMDWTPRRVGERAHKNLPPSRIEKTTRPSVRRSNPAHRRCSRHF